MRQAGEAVEAKKRQLSTLKQNHDGTVRENLPQRSDSKASDEAGAAQNNEAGRAVVENLPQQAKARASDEAGAALGVSNFTVRKDKKDSGASFIAPVTGRANSHASRRGELAVEDLPQPSAKASDEAGAMLDGRGKTCHQPMIGPKHRTRQAQGGQFDPRGCRGPHADRGRQVVENLPQPNGPSAPRGTGQDLGRYNPGV